jgi:hypothetical protein
MYASPATADGGALGGAKLGERQMEDYLLGKKRVDEVLKLNEENVSRKGVRLRGRVMFVR